MGAIRSDIFTTETKERESRIYISEQIIGHPSKGRVTENLVELEHYERSIYEHIHTKKTDQYNVFNN